MIKKKVLIGYLAIVIVLAFAIIRIISFLNSSIMTMSQPHLNKIIVIDPGHGGVDPGAIGPSSTYEKDINLEIAKKLKMFIQEGGGIALMTRTKDIGLYNENTPSLSMKKREDLKNRMNFALKSGADLFISLHLNGHPSSRWFGAQTFYHRDSVESKKLAELIQEELVRVLDKNNHRRAKKAERFYVLETAQANGIPAVIVEAGFITNKREEALLRDPKYQEKIAWAIYVGILRFLAGE
ncbi:MAG: N-acetylmuramoyl-L-alanine amidase [Thermosediminibacterales bacterium]|nr:N-acetylmuramoyl-L-alanine amidase [Thermosediminibacterales bacterium]